MRITDVLRGEHGVFYAQFDLIERTAPEAKSGVEVQTQAALLAAGLASHANLENELLFSALDPFIGQMGPLAVMRMEHDEIDGAFLKLPKLQDLGQARDLLLGAIGTARDHFGKEEQILFHLAERMLDEDTLEQLAMQWLDRRGVSVV